MEFYYYGCGGFSFSDKKEEFYYDKKLFLLINISLLVG
jgi:hypothetical protein